MELSGIIQKTGLELEAQGFMQDAAASDMAAARGINSGFRQGALGLLGTGLTAAMIV